MFLLPKRRRHPWQDEIDLAFDPPPELTIEVDVSRSSLSRFPIYSAIGIPEAWRYDGEKVTFYTLDGNTYRVLEKSKVLPPLTAARASIFLETARTEKWTAWLRSVREWVRSQS
ncbi:MAG: Uma2 family endonuclease [Acidobacteria bacterium]|nr:Uma2 family endonuclease [Acidobacteriota bacterium]